MLVQSISILFTTIIVLLLLRTRDVRVGMAQGIKGDLVSGLGVEAYTVKGFGFVVGFWLLAAWKNPDLRDEPAF